MVNNVLALRVLTGQTEKRSEMKTSPTARQKKNQFPKATGFESLPVHCPQFLRLSYGC